MVDSVVPGGYLGPRILAIGYGRAHGSFSGEPSPAGAITLIVSLGVIFQPKSSSPTHDIIVEFARELAVLPPTSPSQVLRAPPARSPAPPLFRMPESRRQT